MARMRPILETTFCLARPKTDVSINRLPETSRVKIGGVDKEKKRLRENGGERERERIISVAAVTDSVSPRGVRSINSNNSV